MKTCNTCHQEKALEAFGKDRHQADGLRRRCKQCDRERQKARRTRPEVKTQIAAYGKASRTPYADRSVEQRKAGQGNKTAQNNRYKAKKYGISKPTLHELRSQPCMICATDIPGGQGVMHIDHCHSTGAVRGILCHECNTGLGKFKDSPELLAKAIHYLTRGADYRAVDQES